MKQLLCFSLLLCIALSLVEQKKAPPQCPTKPPPMAERLKRDSSKIADALILSALQTVSVKTSFLSFYKSMDALLEKSKGTPPAREAVETLINTRNTAVKKALNPAQVKLYTCIELQLMPPPRPDKQGPPPSR
ncbi:MAG: hypothetical protein JWP88_37 [Flaviaesturariibacter sp.]|nr:hypothetical protein [Flaviaesturariibacter sp.]